MKQENPVSFKHFLPSATKLRRLCFYTCLSFCPREGWGVVSQHALQVVSQHALQQGGACSRRVPALGGCLLLGGLLGGVCSQWGGACSRGMGGSAPGWGVCGDPPKADGYCCGRYASYCNAFLYLKIKTRVRLFNLFEI